MKKLLFLFLLAASAFRLVAANTQVVSTLTMTNTPNPGDQFTMTSISGNLSPTNYTFVTSVQNLNSDALINGTLGSMTNLSTRVINNPNGLFFVQRTSPSNIVFTAPVNTVYTNAVIGSWGFVVSVTNNVVISTNVTADGLTGILIMPTNFFSANMVVTNGGPATLVAFTNSGTMVQSGQSYFGAANFSGQALFPGTASGSILYSLSNDVGYVTGTNGGTFATDSSTPFVINTNGSIVVNNTTQSSNTNSGAEVIAGGLGVFEDFFLGGNLHDENGTIHGASIVISGGPQGFINSTVIGNTTPELGSFTSLNSTGSITNGGVYYGNGSGLSNVTASAIGNATNFPSGFASDNGYFTNTILANGNIQIGPQTSYNGPVTNIYFGNFFNGSSLGYPSLTWNSAGSYFMGIGEIGTISVQNGTLHFGQSHGHSGQVWNSLIDDKFFVADTYGSFNAAQMVNATNGMSIGSGAGMTNNGSENVTGTISAGNIIATNNSTFQSGVTISGPSTIQISTFNSAGINTLALTATNLITAESGILVSGGGTTNNGTGFYGNGGGLTNVTASTIGNATNFPKGLQADSEGITNNLNMSLTTGSGVGVITKGGSSFLFDFTPPGGDGRNTFLGINAGNFTMTTNGGGGPSYAASYNTGIGYGALLANTWGFYNTAVGYNALTANTSGQYNSAFGLDALVHSTTAIQNSAFGYNALGSTTTGNANTAMGFNALQANTIGIRNLALGVDSGFTLVNGSSNLFLGYFADTAVTNVTNSIAIGSGATVTANNQTVLGNASTTSTVIAGTISSPTTGVVLSGQAAAGIILVSPDGTKSGTLTWGNDNTYHFTAN